MFCGVVVVVMCWIEKIWAHLSIVITLTVVGTLLFQSWVERQNTLIRYSNIVESCASAPFTYTKPITRSLKPSVL